MVSRRCIGQNASRSHSFWELQVGCPKFGEVSLEPQLNHLGWLIEIGFEGFISGHLVQQVVEVGEEERPRGYVIK